jgi:hypothetical protein
MWAKKVEGMGPRVHVELEGRKEGRKVGRKEGRTEWVDKRT